MNKNIKRDVKKVIEIIKRGWAKNCLFRNKGNKEIGINSRTLETLLNNDRDKMQVEKKKKEICKCCLEGAIYLASKQPEEVEKYLRSKLQDKNTGHYTLADFNDSCDDKRQVLRFLNKTV